MKNMQLQEERFSLEVMERDEMLTQKSVLNEVQQLVSEDVFVEILDFLSESFTCEYLLTDKPVGVVQNDDYLWGQHFVNQTQNGGFNGDDFAGTVSIPISSSRYFQFSYSM